jgi:hypothetical protein
VGGIKLWVDGHGADEEVIELVPERRKRIEVRNQDAVFGTHRQPGFPRRGSHVIHSPRGREKNVSRWLSRFKRN